MKINDIKYFSSYRYSGKLKGFVVERESYDSPYFIVQPTHILLNEIEENLEDNEVDLLTFHYNVLYDSYEDVKLTESVSRIYNR